MPSVKNYTEQGGERTVIKGELEIADGGKLKINGQEFNTGSGGEITLSPVAYQADCNSTNVAGIRSDFNDLLQAMRDAGLMSTEVPYIKIKHQSGDVTVTEGKIGTGIIVEAVANDGRKLNYQWYSNKTKSNQDGEIMVGQNSTVFDIPTDLTEGLYYYYCVASAEDTKSLASDVMTAKVLPAS